MKFITLLPLAALAAAFVIPDEAITAQIVTESEGTPESFLGRLPSKDDIFSHVEDTLKTGVAYSENALDNAFSVGKKAVEAFQDHVSMTAFDVESWLASASDSLSKSANLQNAPHHKKPHHPHPPHHHKPNLTVYELIAKSKYTTKFAKLINEFPALVQQLNGTGANFTIFVPTDKAFEKIPEHHKKPSEELIRKILSYHISDEFYPAGRVLVSHTIPSTLQDAALGGEKQRLRVEFGLLKGLTVNFYAKVIAVNIFGTNGVIHGVDSILLPPPTATTILSLLPGEFSTLDLALSKTGLGEEIAKSAHTGGTLFAPSNFAFKKLGPKINAFLFSSYGEKYLKALLKYHVVANQTLYSDAFYGPKTTQLNAVDGEIVNGIPKGVFHVDLPTLLGDKSLSIDVGRYGGLINIRINGYTDVAVLDGIAKDGVIHIPHSVLIPPKSPGGVAYMGEELSVEDLKERLGDLVEETKVDEVKEKGWWEL